MAWVDGAVVVRLVFGVLHDGEAEVARAGRAGGESSRGDENEGAPHRLAHGDAVVGADLLQDAVDEFSARLGGVYFCDFDGVVDDGSR